MMLDRRPRPPVPMPPPRPGMAAEGPMPGGNRPPMPMARGAAAPPGPEAGRQAIIGQLRRAYSELKSLAAQAGIDWAEVESPGEPMAGAPMPGGPMGGPPMGGPMGG